MRKPIIGASSVFALGAIFVAWVEADTRTGGGCREAQAWVTEHARALPPVAAEMARLPPVYRKYAFDALDPEAKSRIWRERLQGVLNERRLTRKQRALVQEGIGILSPQLYRSHARVPEPWRSAVARAFSRSEEVEIFERLGPSPNATGLLPNCGCNSQDDCPPNRICNFESCNPTASGCGPGGVDQCGDGVCRVP